MRQGNRRGGEKTLAVVIGVDKPNGNRFGATRFDFSALRVKHVNAVDFHLYLAVVRVFDADVGFAKHHKQVTLARVFEVVRHM